MIILGAETAQRFLLWVHERAYKWAYRLDPYIRDRWAELEKKP